MRLAVLPGSLLVLFGMWLWIWGPLQLPTRTPGVESRFEGWVLLMLAASPALAGALIVAVGFGVDRSSKWLHGLMLVAIALCGAAFALAPRS